MAGKVQREESPGSAHTASCSRSGAEPWLPGVTPGPALISRTYLCAPHRDRLGLGTGALSHPSWQRAHLLPNPGAVTPRGSGGISSWTFRSPSPPLEHAFPQSRPEVTGAVTQGLVTGREKVGYKSSSWPSQGQGEPRVTERFNTGSVAAASTAGEGSTKLAARTQSPAGDGDMIPGQPVVGGSRGLQSGEHPCPHFGDLLNGVKS